MGVDTLVGTLTTISAQYVNPYDGSIMDLSGDYYINTTYMNGGTETSDFLLGNPFDNFYRLEDEFGDLLIEGYEFIFPSSGDDVVIFSSLNHTLDGLTFATSSGNDIVWSNEGNDTINGNAGNDILHGGPGDDVIDGGADNDTLIGASGDDTLYGGLGDDIIYGGSVETTVLDKDFIDGIAFPNLIEGVNITNLEPPGDASLGVNEGNLDFSFDSSAEITFREGYAGYNNTLGMYRVADDGRIEMGSILWENVKDAGIDQTHLIDLPLGENGGELGFFIISNGDRKNNYDNLDTDEAGNIRFVYDYNGADERDATIHDSGGDITVLYDDGVQQQVLNGDAYHTTSRDGSTDINADGENHVVTGLAEDGNDDILRIGFEDLKNRGDADYEDVLFDVNIVPVTLESREDGDDILYAGAGDDQLYGGAGDDILIFGEGYDQATGGSGSDVFALDFVDTMVDTIFDFETGPDGDVINLTDVLSGYDPLTDAITDFVRFTESGVDTSVEVNVDGQGDDYQALFMVKGGLDLAVTDMLENGTLVADQSAII